MSNSFPHQTARLVFLMIDPSTDLIQVEREVVQKRTFTRWMNLHLEKCDPPIEVHDLFRDIQDGRILMALLEELSGCKLVKLVSIDAADVADGNSSIVLGLIWNIILFFQIKELTGNIRSQFPSCSSLSSIPTTSDSDVSYSMPSDERQSASTAMREHSKAIRKLLQWVQKRTRNGRSSEVDDCQPSLVDDCQPSLVDDCQPSLVDDCQPSLVDDCQPSLVDDCQPSLVDDCQPSLVDDCQPSLVDDCQPSLVDDCQPSLVDDCQPSLVDDCQPSLVDDCQPSLVDDCIVHRPDPNVTINAPDEQSIMIYVSQFLEHFPGIEVVQPEEPCKLIEQTVSVGRLNFRDPDFNHKRNGAHRNQVRERSHVFEKDCAQTPPKILISSVSEDRGAMSPPFRPAASRLWSSEDFLADSPHMDDDYSSSVVEATKEPDSEVLPNSISNSPQLSYTHSPTGSSVPESVNTESVMDDSAISSPDSWVESEFGVMPEKFSESRSDSSLCDSGTSWDVYRATPVEVTIDEGFVPSIVDRVSDDQSITESYIDEGIYSLSSLQSTQEKIQGHTENNKEDNHEVKEEEVSPENHEQDLSLEQVPGQNKAEVTKEVGSKERDTILPQKDEMPTEQEPSSDVCDAEELANSSAGDLLETDQTNQSQPSLNTELSPDHIGELVEQNSIETSAYREAECLKEAVDVIGDAQDSEGLSNVQTDTLSDRNNTEKVEVKNECQKTHSSLEEDSRDGSKIVKERNEGVEETQSEAGEEVLRGDPDPPENISTETSDALANTHPTDQGGESMPNSEPRMAINIPLISISSEPEEQDDEETCIPVRSDYAGDEEATGSKGTDTEVNSPGNPDELSYDSNEQDASNLPEIPSCLISDDVKEIVSGEITDRHLDDTDERDIGNSSNADISGPDTTDNMEISETKWESPHHNRQTDDTDRDFISQASTDAGSHPVNTEQDIDSTDLPSRHQDKQGDTIPATTQQNTDPDNTQPNGNIGALDLFYTDFDRSSPTEDLVGDLMEPMDLFYPDKEEPVFTEPPDNEMQSWPSVLSVSALQPAPASETLPQDKPLNLLEEDFRDGGDLLQEQDEVTDEASEPQEQCLLPGEKMEGLWGSDVPVDGSDLSEAQPQSPGSARENTEPMRCDSKSSSRQEESQMPPVLRHRKGVRFTEAKDSQTAVTALTRKADNTESECCPSNKHKYCSTTARPVREVSVYYEASNRSTETFRLPAHYGEQEILINVLRQTYQSTTRMLRSLRSCFDVAEAQVKGSGPTVDE
ncbi:hypothetical protein PAMP_006464 [Pampus punctatissimus]